MLVSRVSQATGKTNTREIALTAMQVTQLESAGRRAIQDICPELSDQDREFIISGVTPEEWAVLFPPEENEDEHPLHPNHAH